MLLFQGDSGFLSKVSGKFDGNILYGGPLGRSNIPMWVSCLFELLSNFFRLDGGNELIRVYESVEGAHEDGNDGKVFNQGGTLFQRFHKGHVR
jgi:hypothetical protein